MPKDSGGSKGDARDASPPGSKFFQFHAVFGKFWQNHMLAPPLGEILDLLLIEFFVVNPILSDQAILYRIGL